MKDVFSKRITLLRAALLLVTLAFLGKLFFVQVVDGEAYKERALNQYVSPVSDTFKRGQIFFQYKDGRLFGAATEKHGFTVAIVPRLIKSPENAYLALSEALPSLDARSFFTKVGKKNDPYEEVASRVSEAAAVRIRDLGIEGVSIHREKWRFYPGGALAAHVLGFVGFRGDELGGRYGVERYYDDTLRRDGKELSVNLFAEVFANVGRTFFYRGRREGDVVLSIEPEVQGALEGKIQAIAEKWNAQLAGGVIIDPQEGNIFAMATVPAFDPNRFSDVDDYAVFINSAVENVFEMGSIVKPLTIAAGLDAGAITPDDTYVDRGFVVQSGRRIENYDGKARGEVPIQEILNQSLNTGAVYVMQEMGREAFAEYFRRFNFGEETGIDLPNEAPGLVENLGSPRDIEYATASFGQGIAMTPIAMVRALSALANGGVPVTPHVADRVEYSLGSKKIVSYGRDKRVLEEETAEEVTRMLVRVVDEALAGGGAGPARYSIAAKTGTAQIARKDGEGYHEDRFLHSFFGYFPAYDPRFLIFLYVAEPEGVRYASETLTSPFMDLAKFLIHYYEIPPDR